jgi:hypothetical protein
LNIALLGGLITACLSFFVLNRLIPVQWQARAALEVAGFFGVWASCLLLVMLIPIRKSARIIAWTTGLMALALPVIDGLTVPLQAWGSMLHLTVNGMFLLTGLSAMGSLRFLPVWRSHD